MEKFLSILITLALETFWDRDTDLETHLLGTNEVSKNSKLFTYGDVSLHYGDLFNFVFRDEVSQAMADFARELIKARGANAESAGFVVYTYEDPTTTIYVSDLMEVLGTWEMNQPSLLTE